MGKDGEPVSGGETGLAAWPASIPVSDEFETGIGLQWQWQANPDPAWFQARKPGLRLYAAPADTMYQAGQFLSQIMQSYDFDMEVSLESHLQPGDAAGIGMMGYPYHALTIEEGTIRLCRGEVAEYGRFIPETVRETSLTERKISAEKLMIRMRVRQGIMDFAFALPGQDWEPVGEACSLAAGGWTAARPGLFCLNRHGRYGGYADIGSVIFRDPDGTRINRTR